MNSGKTWILVADNSRAQLYLNVAPGKQLQKVKDIASPPEQIPRHTDSHDGQDRRHDGELFAGQLCTLLNEGRVKHNFDRLILVAAPRFLGQIRAKLDKATHASVSATLDKDFMSFSDSEIQQHLHESFFTF
jgi:protein required for attachment to host cells